MKIFSNIYKYNLWGFGSGTGSLKFNNQKYIDFMNDFLKNHTDVSSIIDLGCGDWQLHKHINLNNQQYLGIDIVEKVIEVNKKKYGKPKINFLCKNFLEDKIPNADLIIVKDVLQHLSDDNIKAFLNNIKNVKYKYLLITNDVSRFNLNYFDIPNGMYKPLDITKGPYNYSSNILLKYYEKIYLIIFASLLIGILILVKTKGYKLYILSLILLIIYGYGILPQKIVHLIKSKK